MVNLEQWVGGFSWCHLEIFEIARVDEKDRIRVQLRPGDFLVLADAIHSFSKHIVKTDKEQT